MNNSDGLPKLLLSEEDHNLSRERLARKNTGDRNEIHNGMN
ncbi:hypothetical protein Nos7107_2243 [Nostoc sp. PCC 7107]|nr:hypothetical protein Nos7107_2243 [Nostoc sp. PCC 7107]